MQDKVMILKPKSVDAYIAAAPKEVQGKLKELRKIIKAMAPKAEERISYGMPFYEYGGTGYKGRFIYFAAFKNHISLFIPPSSTGRSPRELEKYSTGKAAYQFPLNKPLPLSLIERTIKALAKKKAEIEAKPHKTNSKGMKAYASFDLYLTDQPLRNQLIIRALRKLVKRVAPQLRESVKWGNGCWVDVRDKIPVAYVYSAEDYVQFGFNRGSSLKDPKKLLHGEGRYVRHIKVYKKSDIHERDFSNLLKQACNILDG